MGWFIYLCSETISEEARKLDNVDSGDILGHE